MPTGSKKTKKARSVPAREWTDAQRETLEFHIRYWIEIGGFNNWYLYNQYKKHLPASEQSQVDEMINVLKSGGDDSEIEALVTRILEQIWDVEDWDAFIRDPRLLDHEMLEPDIAEDWLRDVRQGK